MSRLEDELQEAARGSVGFDHTDIARRVRRRRRNRRVGVALAGVIAVAGVGGLVLDRGEVGDEKLEVAGPESDTITVDELVADRWVVFAYSEVTVDVDPPPILDFHDSGELFGHDGCVPIAGTWELGDSRLHVELEELEEFEEAQCIGGDSGLTELLASNPTVDRFDAFADSLRLSSGDDFLAFERFDRMGEVPTPEKLVGDWQSTLGDGLGSVTFEADGSGVAELGDCSGEFDWALDGDRLDVTGLDAGVDCGSGGAADGPAVTSLAEGPRTRLYSGRLWLSSPIGIETLIPIGPDSDPDSTTPEPDDGEVPAYVVSSSDGVTLHGSDGQVTDIVDVATARAFAVGPDLVVYQPASDEAATYPPHPDGVPMVWSDGEEHALPVAPDTTRAELLDARVLDGRPVALVAEISGGVGPEDTYEELVLFDLGTLGRSTFLRRPAWESGHFAARILPDGDVVGLHAVEALSLMSRWTAGSDHAVWSTEAGSESHPTLIMNGDGLRLVESRFDAEFDLVLDIRDYDTDGYLLGEQEIPIVPTDEFDTGVFCADADGGRLLCGRGGGPPVLVAMSDGTARLLEGPVGGYPTVVRPG